ncbi:MAG: SH3 domain-containing protein [Planktomarina sp.]
MRFKTLRHTLTWVFAVVFSAQIAMAEGARGPVTNLPLPRYVSMKASEGNVRRGPSLSHRIDWILVRRDIPLRVVAEHGHWRKVVDMDGAGGWIHYSLLSGIRTVVVRQDRLTVHRQPDPNSKIDAIFQENVLARLGECQPNWCRITADGYSGWAPRSSLWGITEGEIRD